MLKKCSKIEKIIKQTDIYDKEGLPKELFERIKKRQNNVAFQRGSMKFDDYNYVPFNKYILVDPNLSDSESDILGYIPPKLNKNDIIN